MSGGRNSEKIVLAINVGSSSLKFALFGMDGTNEHRLAHGAVERVGGTSTHARITDTSAGTNIEVTSDTPCNDFGAALHLAFELLAKCDLPSPEIVGHRVVHGGPHHVQPALVDAPLLASLRSLTRLAPLHMFGCIAGIEAITARSPGMPQVACFDTAFHAALPEIARTIPLPARFNEIRRYGFHGLSYEYILSSFGTSVPSRMVIAHLGSGASLVAVKDGRAVDTTMGLTPTGGILMGTRTGDLDPGILIYLAREKGLDPDALEHLVNHEGGLLAVGGTADVQSLLARAKTDSRARLALEMFAYSIRKSVGAFAAVLGGIDTLVFTGGIGEHVPEVRAQACEGLAPIGIQLDAAQNAAGEPIISAPSSPALVKIIKADEELVIARHARPFA